jgi:hypothetical protein
VVAEVAGLLQLRVWPPAGSASLQSREVLVLLPASIACCGAGLLHALLWGPGRGPELVPAAVAAALLEWPPAGADGLCTALPLCAAAAGVTDGMGVGNTLHRSSGRTRPPSVKNARRPVLA